MFGYKVIKQEELDKLKKELDAEKETNRRLRMEIERSNTIRSWLREIYNDLRDLFEEE